MKTMAAALLASLPLLSAIAAEQSDWPCLAPLVPNVSAEMVWQGPRLPPAGDWHADPAVAALVASLAAQETDIDEGNAQLRQFLRQHRQHRPLVVARILAGLLEENDRNRSRVIEHLTMLAERQRSLADIVARLNDERDKAGAGAESELIDRLNFSQRTYYETQRTLRYACEIPGRLDQRLGVYAKTLESGLH